MIEKLDGCPACGSGSAAWDYDAQRCDDCDDDRGAPLVLPLSPPRAWSIEDIDGQIVLTLDLRDVTEARSVAPLLLSAMRHADDQ